MNDADKSQAQLIDELNRLRFENQELKRIKYQFDLLVAQAVVGVYIIQGGSFAYVNKKFANTFGYSLNEMIHELTVDDIIYPDDRDLVRNNLRRRTDGEIFNIQYTFRGQKKDGTIIHIEANGSVTTYNKHPAVIGTLIDITDRIQVEQERAQLQQDLIDAHRQAINELSTPIIPIMDGIIILPLVGSVGADRARTVMRNLLAGISQHRAKVVIVDITGVNTIDTQVVGYLNRAIQAARLKGAHAIVTGLSDALAEAIVDMGIDWSTIDTLSSLQAGLHAAIQYLHNGHRGYGIHGLPGFLVY